MTSTHQRAPALPRAGEQIERASRVLGLLVRAGADETQFRDLLPYVLELLLSGTRMIHEESKGKRTAAFSRWWAGEPLPDRGKIEQLRHAELKKGRTHAESQWKTQVNAQPDDFPGLPIAEGDTVTTVVWFWKDGPFARQQVMATLQTYLVQLRAVYAEAERLLAR